MTRHGRTGATNSDKQGTTGNTTPVDLSRPVRVMIIHLTLSQMTPRITRIAAGGIRLVLVVVTLEGLCNSGAIQLISAILRFIFLIIPQERGIHLLMDLTM